MNYLGYMFLQMRFLTAMKSSRKEIEEKVVQKSLIPAI